MRALILAATALLVACNSNSSPSADREAQVDPPPTPAPMMRAAEALSGIAVEAIQPETMSDADIAALGGMAGRCVIRLTSVAFPSFLYEPGGAGTIKLNGKLITLPRPGDQRFADGGLSVLLRPVGGAGNSGLPEEDMIVMLPGAKDELGFRGYRQCAKKDGSTT